MSEIEQAEVSSQKQEANTLIRLNFQKDTEKFTDKISPKRSELLFKTSRINQNF